MLTLLKISSSIRGFQEPEENLQVHREEEAVHIQVAQEVRMVAATALSDYWIIL